MYIRPCAVLGGVVVVALSGAAMLPLGIPFAIGICLDVIERTGGWSALVVLSVLLSIMFCSKGVSRLRRGD
jgi:hypothetical protein